MTCEPLDVEKTVTDLVMTDNITEKKQLAKKILETAQEKGITLLASTIFTWPEAETSSKGLLFQP